MVTRFTGAARAAALSALALPLIVVQAASAQEYRPAVIYDLGGKFDGSFNEAAHNGALRFTAETGVEVMEFELTNEAQRVQAMNRMIDRGATTIVAVGFAQADALDAAAKDNPDVNFGIIDVGWLDGPNIAQYVFREEQGSYLVGVAAAMASETGAVGFVGGMDIPLIRRFACGYRQGVLATNPDATVFENMTGTTASAWNDPARGKELATGQFGRGADVVFHAAGGTGRGVINAAVDAGKLAIGVDSNQNGVAPGSVLTSMLKRVDVAVHEVLSAGADGSFTGGVSVLGLAEEGVDWALDENNADLVDDDMIAAVNAARAAIIAGDIVVHDYMTNDSCTF